MKNLPLIFLPLLIACAPDARRNTSYEDFSQEYYAPEYADGFKIFTNGNQLMLETYRPDTMRMTIPQEGFDRIACMSSTYVGLLEAADADGQIVAVSGKHFLSNPRVKAHAAEVGFEGAMDYESLVASAPGIVLIYGVGGRSALAAKLDELGMKYLYVGDFEEQDPLGRAEWMVALGALAGKDTRATFGDVAAAYRPIAGSVTVMLNAPYGGAWLLPGRDGYMTRLIEDAGGKITVTPAPGYESKPVDMEIAVPAVNAAQFWLNSGGANVANVDFHGEKWEQKRDFFEAGTARPDLVLNELQQIFRHSADSLQFFRRI